MSTQLCYPQPIKYLKHRQAFHILIRLLLPVFQTNSQVLAMTPLSSIPNKGLTSKVSKRCVGYHTPVSAGLICPLTQETCGKLVLQMLVGLLVSVIHTQSIAVMQQVALHAWPN